MGQLYFQHTSSHLLHVSSRWSSHILGHMREAQFSVGSQLLPQLSNWFNNDRGGSSLWRDISKLWLILNMTHSTRRFYPGTFKFGLCAGWRIGGRETSVVLRVESELGMFLTETCGDWKMPEIPNNFTKFCNYTPQKHVLCSQGPCLVGSYLVDKLFSSV